MSSIQTPNYYLLHAHTNHSTSNVFNQRSFSINYIDNDLDNVWINWVSGYPMYIWYSDSHFILEVHASNWKWASVNCMPATQKVWPTCSRWRIFCCTKISLILDHFIQTVNWRNISCCPLQGPSPFYLVLLKVKCYHHLATYH